MKFTLLAGASALAMGLASSPAMAGNIVLTGHDNDYHCDAGSSSSACSTLVAEANYVANGSSLPVLVIDNGSELSSSLTIGGFTNYVAESVSSVTAGMFDHTKYSAFAVASVSTCGGCDNPVGTGTALAAYSSAIDSFFNAGGGILGLSGATDPNAYAYVPEAGGTTTAIDTASGFVATATGLAGIPGFMAVNGDETHNTFSGFASFYKVAEVYNPTGGMTGPAVTIFGTNGTIGCTGTSCTITGGGVPEPSTWAMLGLGFFGLGLASRRKKIGVQLSASA